MPEQEPLFDSFGLLIRPEAGETLHSLDAAALRPLLDLHGALLFRGFPVDASAFEAFTARFPARFITHGASVRRSLSPDSRTQKVTAGTAPLVLHRELAFSPFSPDLMWFYCVSAPEQGGETTFADGRALWRRLSEGARRLFEDREIRYWNKWAPGSWRAYFGDVSEQEVCATMPGLGMRGGFEPDGSLSFYFTSSGLRRAPDGQIAFSNGVDIHFQYLAEVAAFQVAGDQTLRHNIALADGAPIPAAVAAEVREVAASLERWSAWRPGDLMMLDNRWILHGRRGFADEAKREIYVRMAFEG